nr:hypothetical protein [uncultured Holophaga sp.]
MDRHVHLEGSLDPAWIRERAHRRSLPVPRAAEALWRGEAGSFRDFIESFVFSCSFLDGQEAVEAALEAALGRLPPPEGAALRGLDLWVSPHWLVRERRQLSLDSLWQGLDSGIRRAAGQGIRVAVVVEAVNHFGPAHGQEVLDLVAGNLPPWVVGFSTGGLEQVPFRDWAPVFDRARVLGLRLAAHAGENGPGTHVREAILEAGVERIVHATRAGGDPATLELLAGRRIPVDVCLSSNRALVEGMGAHPLPSFLEAGVRCGLGTDDPGIIPCNLPGEWALASRIGLGDEALRRLARESAEDAWALQIGA